MRSSRLPPDLTANAIARAVEARRASNRDLIDLTESNPTRVGLSYPRDLLAPLADPSGLTYDPQPLGLMSARQAVAREWRPAGGAPTPSLSPPLLSLPPTGDGLARRHQAEGAVVGQAGRIREPREQVRRVGETDPRGARRVRSMRGGSRRGAPRPPAQSRSR